MSHSPLPPLFTTLPLRPSFSCSLTNSPNLATSSHMEPLTFPKHTLSSTASTDFEIHSDGGHESGTGRSISLLTDLFQSQSHCMSPQISSDSSAQPRSPHRKREEPSVCPKPILRRDTASDDGCLSSNAVEHEPPPFLNRRKSCLKFTVVPCSSDSAPSPHSSYSRSHRSLTLSDELDFQPRLSVLESESDDQGYEEDDEGGFTSDEDGDGAFNNAPLVRRRAFAPQVPSCSPWRRATVDARPSRHPGKQISISTSKPFAEKCTRHFSPPPTAIAELALPPAPPAAHSPSARGLCRRRGPGSEKPVQEGRLTFDDSAVVSILRLPSSPGMHREKEPPMLSFVNRRSSAPAFTVADRVEALSVMAGSEDARKGLEVTLRRMSP